MTNVHTTQESIPESTIKKFKIQIFIKNIFTTTLWCFIGEKILLSSTQHANAYFEQGIQAPGPSASTKYGIILVIHQH